MTPPSRIQHAMPEVHAIGMPAGKPVSQFLRTLLFGTLLGLTLLVIQPFIGSYYGGVLPGYLLTGWVIAFCLWTADRSWHASLAPLLNMPSSPLALLTCVPFWFMAGGIGYVLGLLVAKKSGILLVYDIPIKPLFAFGGKFGAVARITVYLVPYLAAVLRTGRQRTEQQDES